MTPAAAAPDTQPKRRRSRVFRSIAWIAEVALVTLLVASSGAAYVTPETLWWLQVAAVFSGVLVFIGALIAIWAALARRWRRLALYLALCLSVVLMPELQPHPEPVEAASDAPGLTVMTFNANVRYAGSKQDTFAELLRRDRPHIVALQEFAVRFIRGTGVTMGAPLLGPLLKGRAYEPSWPDKRGKDFVFSRPIFSRIEALGPGELLAGNPPEGIWSSGGLTRRVYEWQGRPIAVYNVHLHSFSSRRPWRDEDERLSLFAWGNALLSYRDDFKVRAEQARELKRMLEAESYPFIVCGDLNSTPKNWVYTYLTQGLRDAFREVGAGWGGTYPARFPLVRIDHVIVSPEWSVRRARVETELFSDHRPVVAELVLQAQPAMNL